MWILSNLRSVFMCVCAVVTVLIHVVPADSRIDSGYISATASIEQYHKTLKADNADDAAFARSALAARPVSAGFIQSDVYPVRCHYETAEFEARAREILQIIEDSWQKQVLVMGFTAPPPDCGYGGSDDLDVYIRALPQGVGGYAAFACYIDSTPEADAASFIAIANNLGDAFLRSAVTHEFNHVLQNAMDYWENIAFKEMTATWVMDWMYDEDNQYFSYLRSYQLNPDWPMHKFSTTNTYQYGASIFLHFLSEYYGGGDPSVVVDLWKACVQNEHNNEPDFQDALKQIVPAISGGMDNLNDALTEYAAWRTITSSRDDGVHFHDGPDWPAGAEIEPDSVVDLSGNLPVTAEPVKAPFDYGFCYIDMIHTAEIDSAISVEFSGDSAVDWAVVLVHNREGHSTHLTQPMNIRNGWGILLLNRGVLNRADDLTIGIVNLSHAGFDPDQGTDGERRSFTVTIKRESPDSSLILWTDQPMTGPGMEYGLNLELEYHEEPATAEFWLLIEIAGSFFSIFADQTGAPAPLTFSVTSGMSASVPLLGFELPELEINLPVRWHAGLLRSGVLVDYTTTRSNCVSVFR